MVDITTLRFRVGSWSLTETQRVAQFFFFGLQVSQGVHRWLGFAGKLVDNLDPGVTQNLRLARIIRHQANAADAELAEDRRWQAEVSTIGLEAQNMYVRTLLTIAFSSAVKTSMCR